RRTALLRVISAHDLTEIRSALDDTPEAHEVCAGALAEASLELNRRVKEREDRCAHTRVNTEVLDGPASAVLTAASHHADLLIAGAQRLDGERRGVRIGPTTHTLLRHTACPLLIVPHR
ncbi:universal stress protein, partial [Catenulispora subtropica]|uniref:universal stress protein n=1 Tax=Catenulispora subtropica TaxID=450798 RepID=UPI0031D35240